MTECCYLQPNEWNTLIIEPKNGILQWGQHYQLQQLNENCGYPSFDLITEQIYTFEVSHTDFLYIDVFVKYPLELKKGELVLYLQLLRNEKVAQCLIKENTDDFIALKQEFQPVALFPELPLPHQSSQPSVADYSLHDYVIAKQQMNKLILTDNGERFITPHPGLKISAGEEGITNEQLALLSQALTKVPATVWHNSKSKGLFPGIPEQDLVIHIPLKNETPIKHKVRRLNNKLHQRCREQLQKEKDMGLIEDSASEYAFPILCVEKKNGKLRVCGDYRTLNKVAKSDSYPLPVTKYLIASLRGAKYISLFDLSSGFQQLFVHGPHRERLAIITPFGLYQPIRLPYGYLNGPPAFQRQYDITMSSMIEWSRAFIDDLTLHDAENQRIHDLKVATVLHNIHRREMVVNEEKTMLLRTSLPYL